MICPARQLLDSHKLSKLLPPEARSVIARGEREDAEGRRGHAQKDRSALGAESSVQGRDTGVVRLLIGRGQAERGVARSEARGLAGVQQPLGELRLGISACGRLGPRS